MANVIRTTALCCDRSEALPMGSSEAMYRGWATGYVVMDHCVPGWRKDKFLLTLLSDATIVFAKSLIGGRQTSVWEVTRCLSLIDWARHPWLGKMEVMGESWCLLIRNSSTLSREDGFECSHIWYCDSFLRIGRSCSHWTELRDRCTAYLLCVTYLPHF